MLEGVDFRNPGRAMDALERLRPGLPPRIAARIQLLLASIPDPDRALQYLERLHRQNPGAFDRIASSPAALRHLIATFAYSNFLAETVLSNPEWPLQVSNSGSFYRVLTREDFDLRLGDFLGPDHPGVPTAASLARFRRRSILRILLRDVLGAATLADVTEELSSLADAILDVTYRRLREELVRRHGEPRLPDGRVCGFSVIALGKLGAQELNYSSDIDVMFLHGGNGETDGDDRISNAEFFKKIANRITQLLSTYTADGMVYRVDLRLRPDGTLGEIVTSLEGARSYYQDRGRDWEKQMLIKARVAAGEPEPGMALLDFVEPLIYQSSLDFRAVEAVSETRQRISEKLASRRGAQSGLDVKLCEGGIRDIEFLTQCLQRLYGGREPWVRHGGTLLALARLHDKDLLSETEYSRLASAYQFLRHLEHRLQFLDDRQTHTLPRDSEELEILARKMPGDGSGTPPTADRMQLRLERHRAQVTEIYLRVVHAHTPLAYGPPETAAEEPPVELPAPPTNLIRALEQRAPHLAVAVAQAHLHRGRDRFEHFLEKAASAPEILTRLDSDGPLAARVLDLFEHSSYFADQLLRQPELLDELLQPCNLAAEEWGDSGALRRFYRRQMLRIQSASIFGPAEIFSTLDQTSALADRVIAAAYQVALGSAPPPASAGYTPSNQMMVVALGRLGMREFDLGSDADLIFVLPDADADEHLYWTAVAERMIQAISAYTGAGVMFTIDTRLRPNGREGDLVQTEGSYKQYFREHAEAWEGISYMKARAVAGNLERATEFLHELQDVDWRRYGQSGRSRQELAAMRTRLEKEQGPRNPLKAGMGGYYDIDFALMYLRLKGAGIFYKALNTPERIDVIEKMGHLDPEDAAFLRAAATFYRAVDHGQRVSTGHAEGSLPTSPAQFEVLTNLVQRWTPPHLHQRRLDATLREIRQGTREFFNRLFRG
jgi:[glutamine synthetase] adenylyltransferase / [glutamine synthetase]-adenylyl-L-tyrosine phosphorylase